MTRAEYYRRLLGAIDSAQDWAGCMPPDEAGAYRAECKELRREVKKRRDRKRPRPSVHVYLLHRTQGVITGKLTRIKGRHWFLCDALGSKPEPFAALKREGWKEFHP